MSTPESWVRFQVTKESIALSQERRREKDKRFPKNRYVGKDTDMRWIGELGEMYFDQWIRSQNVTDSIWLRENPIGNPDFIIEGTRIDIKTVKRTKRLLPTYGIQVTSKQLNAQMDEYFFTCYLTSTETLVLLGGMMKTEFINAAQVHAGDENEEVHEHYLIEDDHAIHNSTIELLEGPQAWLNRVLRR